MFHRITHSCLSRVRDVELQEEAFVHTKPLTCVYTNLPQNEWASVLLLTLDGARSLYICVHTPHISAHMSVCMSGMF